MDTFIKLLNYEVKNGEEKWVNDILKDKIDDILEFEDNIIKNYKNRA